MKCPVRSRDVQEHYYSYQFPPVSMISFPSHSHLTLKSHSHIFPSSNSQMPPSGNSNETSYCSYNMYAIILCAKVGLIAINCNSSSSINLSSINVSLVEFSTTCYKIKTLQTLKKITVSGCSTTHSRPTGLTPC